ncbi:MAG: hypothetical protein ACOX2Q_07505 [Dehalobacterium sp.]
MSAIYSQEGGVSECVGLLISILIRYPEVGSIHFDPQTHEIRFNLYYFRRKGEVTGICKKVKQF